MRQSSAANGILLMWIATACAGEDPVVTLDADRVRVTVGAMVTVMGSVSGDWADGDMVQLTGLPTGVSAEAATVAEDGSVSLTVHASKDADMGGPFPITATLTDAPEVTVPLYVAGTPGTLDSSFSFDGRATYQVHDDGRYDAPRDLEIDSQGRLLVAGVGQGADPWEGWLIRLLPDGTIDTTFGTAGEVLLEPTSSVQAVAVDDNDAPTMVVVLEKVASTGVGMRALEVDGSVDDSFGNGAWVPLETHENRRLTMRSSGVVVYGYNGMGAFDAAGTRDPAFTSEAFPTLASVASAVSDDSDQLWVGGYSDGSEFVMMRLAPDGGADPTFGDGGTLRAQIPTFHGSDAIVWQVVVLEEGAIALGTTDVGNIYENIPVLIRMNQQGELDAGFGSGGIATVFDDLERGGMTVMGVQDNGPFVLAGYRHLGGTSTQSILRRLHPDGSPDTSFGASGDVDLDDHATDMVLDHVAGRAILLSSDSDGDGGAVLTRIWL